MPTGHAVSWSVGHASSAAQAFHASLHIGIYIHDQIPEAVEVLAVEGLSEEVDHVVDGGHVGDHELLLLDELAHVKVPTFYVLHFVVVLGIVREVTGG